MSSSDLVLDMGKDVEPNLIVEMIQKESVFIGRAERADDDDGEEHGGDDRRDPREV